MACPLTNAVQGGKDEGRTGCQGDTRAPLGTQEGTWF